MPNIKQVIITAFLSFFLSIFAIAHGAFFDLDFSAFSRLSIGGVLYTSLCFFMTLIVIEYLFDLNN